MSDLVEKKTKKNWLYALFISYSISILFYIISLFTNLHNLIDRIGRNIFISMIIFQIILILGWVYIYYRCAYKKPGRKLLAFNLIMFPISVMSTFSQIFNLFPFMHKSTIIYINNTYYKIIFILNLVVGSVFFVFSLKLFKLNKKIQNRLAHVSKD